MVAMCESRCLYQVPLGGGAWPRRERWPGLGVGQAQGSVCGKVRAEGSYGQEVAWLLVGTWGLPCWVGQGRQVRRLWALAPSVLGFAALLTSPRASPRALDHLTILLEFEPLELELIALPQSSLPDKQWLYFYLWDECLTSPVLGSEYLLWSQTLPGRSPGLVRLRALGEH